MEWIKLTSKNKPDREVMAANFKPGTYGYKEKLLGHLHEENGIWVSESDHEVLENVSHFIDIHP